MSVFKRGRCRLICPGVWPGVWSTWMPPTPRSSLREVLRRLADRGDDIAVPRAAAEVPRDRFLDFRLARAAAFAEQAVGRHEHARRAIAALDGVFFPECFLQWMEPLF